MKLVDINFEEFKEQKALLQKLKSMGLPTPKTEHYRYFGIKPILDKEYSLTMPKTQKPEEANHIEIEDGSVVKAPKSLYIEMQKNIKIDDSHYDQIYYLNHLLSERVIHIECEEDMDLKIVHKHTLSKALVPYRIKLTIAAGKRVNFYEEHLVLAQDALYLYGYDIDLQENASLKLVQNRISNLDEFALIAPHSVQCNKKSNFALFTFDFGSAKTLHNYHIVLQEEATTDANHVIFGSSSGRMGNTFHIENRGKESKTTQLSRNILKDKARGIFDGLLIVKNPAKYSSIYQDSKTILLNDGAFMVSKPQMEIYTEYISEATHGSTTGHIDEEALFYLRQRGIEESLAKEMMVVSFLNEIFEKLGDEEIKEEFIKLYEERQ